MNYFTRTVNYKTFYKHYKDVHETRHIKSPAPVASVKSILYTSDETQVNSFKHIRLMKSRPILNLFRNPFPFIPFLRI